jgi:hypothetical protein
MFDRVGDLAERVATHVSRRAFLGRLGQGALGLAAVIGGVLAFPGEAGAGGVKWCCVCRSGGTYPVPPTCYATTHSQGCRGTCSLVHCNDFPNICPQ